MKNGGTLESCSLIFRHSFGFAKTRAHEDKEVRKGIVWSWMPACAGMTM